MLVCYLDTDSFVLCVSTKDIINDLKNLEDLFNFSNLDENHEIFSNEKYIFAFFKIYIPKSIWIDKFICLRSKMYAYKCRNDSKNKLNGFSKSYSKNNKFEEYYICLFEGRYQQECDNYIIRSLNHGMYLQRVKKSHYLTLMKNCVIKMKVKVNHGFKTIKWL